MPVSTPVKVTCTAPTTAPVASSTVPVTVPRLVWACAATANVRTAASKRVCITDFMPLLLLFLVRLAPDNGRVGFAPINKYVNERRLKTLQIVRDEYVVTRDSSSLTDYRQRGSRASANPVV